MSNTFLGTQSSKVISSHSSDYATSESLDSSSSFVRTNNDLVSFLTIVHLVIIAFAILHLIYLVLMIIKVNCSKEKKDAELKKINDSCTICLDNLTDEVQLLCSHSYCARCIVDYAKTRFSFVNVECPYCRSPSRLMVVKFEKTDQNKELYDDITNYNYQLTSTMSTSFCLCIDTFRFFIFYTRQIIDFNNPRFKKQRCVLITLLIIVFIIIFYPVLGSISKVLLIVEDLFIYLFVVCCVSQMFYSSIRRRTNMEQALFQNLQVNEMEQRNEDAPQNQPVIQEVENPENSEEQPRNAI